MSVRDRLFATEEGASGNFVFDSRVVEVFPDMIQRSVPGYRQMLQLTALLAHRFVQPGSRVYDLGCSLGAATRAMRQAVTVEGVRFIAADRSADMIARCRELVAQDTGLAPVDVLESDVCTLPIENASMSVLAYTLQFIEPGRRSELLARIAAGTRAGGALLLSEKIRFEDPDEQALQTDLHHDYKRAQGYSDLEIARKREALERVLIPETETLHLQRLYATGWSRVVRCFQAFNFTSYLAIR